jgi:hypothetical protein
MEGVGVGGDCGIGALSSHACSRSVMPVYSFSNLEQDAAKTPGKRKNEPLLEVRRLVMMLMDTSRDEGCGAVRLSRASNIDDESTWAIICKSEEVDTSNTYGEHNQTDVCITSHG